MRHAHRGAYEHLWAEHRYAVLGHSIKHTRIAAGKLGRVPHLLSFLGFLARHRDEPRRSRNHALLSVYDHIQPHIDRDTRRRLIDAILAGDPSVEDRLFGLIQSSGAVGLYGCRLFYPARGFNKFWDYGEQPGLQVLLGPRMLHVPFSVLRARLEALSGMRDAGLNERLAALKQGIARVEYDAWPELLRMALEDHLMVAVMPTAARLHPRVELPLPPAAIEEVEPMHAALLALERLWDADPAMVPHLPSSHDLLAAMAPERLPWAGPTSPETRETAIAMVIEEFADQLNLECGRKASDSAVPEESGDADAETGDDDGESDSPEGEFPV